jgi:2Fe-2S ferredoxin
METCRLYIVDEFEKENVLEFRPYEYNNLMELVFNELWEEWGDCKGRAMCGTCHIEILEGETGEADPFEQQTLEGLPNKTAHSRLACQLSMTPSLDSMKFRMLKDY